MDIFSAIKDRRSCRNFLSDPIASEILEKILEAGTFAPSAANNQTGEFIVVTNIAIKNEIFTESEKCRKHLIAVVGNPKKTGADMFLEGGGLAYQHGCAR